MVAAPGWSLKALPEMDQEQFELWRELLEERTGIFVSEERKSFLQSSLMQRMRELGIESYRDYYLRVVRDPMGKIEWANLIDRLTVQETRFFRDPAAFDYVDRYIQQNHGQFDKKNPLDIWSVGCSSGEEAYSLAMLAHDALSKFDRQENFMVTGTDISVPVLNKARAGSYDRRRLLTFEEQLIERFFQTDGDGRLHVVPWLKQKSCFAQVNILDLDKVPKTPRHIIFCQNVLIYFRRQRKQEVLNNLVERLAPGGLLLIGMGEMVDWEHPQMDVVKGESITAFIKKRH